MRNHLILNEDGLSIAQWGVGLAHNSKGPSFLVFSAGKRCIVFLRKFVKQKAGNLFVVNLARRFGVIARFILERITRIGKGVNIRTEIFLQGTTLSRCVLGVIFAIQEF